MRKTGTIVTRVRPVKKLFIIEANDLSLFLKIVEFVSQEIVGLSNIILLNDEMIFSNNTVNFINRHDPDIIINYSTRDDNELKQKFKIPTLKLNRDVLPRHLQAPLFIFDNPPLILKYASNNKPFKVFTASLVGNTPQDIAYLLNFGKAANDIKKHLKLSIFKSARISSIDSMEQFLDLVRDHDKNYLYLSVPLAGIRYGFQRSS